MRIFDRQDFLRVNRARARIKVLVDKIGIDAFREHGRGGARGRLGRRARLLARRDPVRRTTSRRTRPPRPEHLRQRRTATSASSTASCETNVQRPAPARASHRRGQGPPRRPDARAAPRPRRRSCASTRGGYARTTVHQNLVLRWVRDESVYEVWQRAAASSSWATPARTRSPTSSAAPAPTRASSGSPARWGSTRRSRSGSSQMEIDDALTRRIHIKMSGCPNGCGQHHIANIGFYGASIKVGEHTIPAYIPHIGGAYEGGDVRYGQRLKAACRPSAFPRRSSAGYASTSPSAHEGEEFNAFVERVGTRRVRGARQGPDDAGRVLPGEHELLHRLEPKSAPFEVERGEGECAGLDLAASDRVRRCHHPRSRDTPPPRRCSPTRSSASTRG